MSLLDAALAARTDLFDDRHTAAFRAFNGFLEGWPDMAVDVYGRSLVLHNYSSDPQINSALVPVVQSHLLERLPWVHSVIIKARHTQQAEARRGVVVHGHTPDRRICEHGVWYAIELLMNQDAGFYLDTRNLRAWALTHLNGKRVLNTFAYTGSLGVAARVGGASQVIHLDHKRAFLNVAKQSYALNGLPVNKADFRAGDFWAATAQLRQNQERFDCVFVDPPFFSLTSQGRVDMLDHSQRVINKVRPLINDEGYLIVINNALFTPGAEYMHTLEELCADGYLQIESLIPVPPDFTGYTLTRQGALPADPAPFNHATKIAVLRVRRKHNKEGGLDNDGARTLTHN